MNNALAALAAAAALLLPARGASAEPPVATKTITEPEVVAIAVQHNPGLRASILELASAQWAVLGEQARYPFTLQLDGGFTRRDAPPETTSIDTGAELRKHLLWGTDLSLRVGSSHTIDPNVYPTTQVSGYGVLARFAVVQPLLRGAGLDVNEADLLEAMSRRTAAEHARDAAASDVLRDVLTAYWELWYANAAVGIQEQSKEVTIKQRDDAAARVTTGSLAPADVLSFETRVATREEDVLNAQLDRERRLEELAREAGARGGGAALGVPAEAVPPIPAPPPANAEAAALAQSPQIRQLQAALDLARIQARTAEEPYRPRLDIDAYVQAQSATIDDAGAAFTQLGTRGALSAHVGLTYEVALDGGARRAAAARARIDVEIAAARLDDAKQAIAADVRIALAREAAARRKVELAERTARIAEQQLAAEQARFQTGTSTALEVLQAEDEVRSARLRVARARAELLQTSLSLQHLTGRLLARYGGASKTVSAARRAPTLGLRPRVGAF